MARASSRMGRVSTIDECDVPGSVGPSSMATQQSPVVQRVPKEEVNKGSVHEPNALLQPLVMHFTAVIQVKQIACYYSIAINSKCVN